MGQDTDRDAEQPPRQPYRLKEPAWSLGDSLHGGDLRAGSPGDGRIIRKRLEG